MEENVIGANFELIINLCVLLALFILFKFYDEPLKLSIIFLILIILDLVWVSNQLYSRIKHSRSNCINGSRFRYFPL